MMVVCQSMDDVAEVLARIADLHLKEEIEVVRFKDRITKPADGWADAMLNFRLPQLSQGFGPHLRVANR